MTKPLTTAKSGQICFAFPDVCLTPGPPVPVPYPNIGMLADAGGSPNVEAGGDPVIRANDVIGSTTGDEAGSGGGVKSGQPPTQKAEFVEVPSRTVEVNGEKVVCMFDQTEQNAKNATGSVLWGVPNVVVGG